MALALSLIVELAEMIQRGVEWLAGGPAPRRSADTTHRDEPPAQRQRAARSARVVRVASGGIVVSGRIDEVCAELDRLAAH